MAEDDFVPVAAQDDFQPVKPAGPSVPISTPDGTPDIKGPIQGKVADVLFSRGKLDAIQKAFGTGWNSGVGDEPFGLSPESQKWMADKGILFDKEKGGAPTILNAQGEAFVRPAAWALDAAMRSVVGVGHALGDAAIEAGVPRDFVAMAGYHALKPDRIGSVTIRPGLPKDIRETIPTEASKPLVDAYHGSTSPFPEVIAPDRPMFFTPFKDEAALYAATSAEETAARMRGDKTYEDPNKQPSVTPVRLRMENPYEVDVWSEGAVNARDIKWLKEHGYDSAIIRDPKDPLATEYVTTSPSQVIRKPEPLVTDLDAAKDLGVIGPEKPSVFEEVQAAKDAVRNRTMNADRKGDVVRSDPIDMVSNPAVDKAGNIRLDLIDGPESMKTVLRSAAEANGGEAAYAAARRGEISLGLQEQLSQATGIPVDQLDITGIGRRLTNDVTLRTHINAMVQSANEVWDLARAAKMTGTADDLIAFQKAWMRHDLIQEQVAGLTAEWGRTGNVFQEFAERVKDTKQLGDFLREKGKGKGVNDLRDLVDKLGSLNSPDQIPRLLQDVRKPGFFDKLHYYWVNSILSGQFSQATYLISDFMFATYDNLAIKPLAGAVGKVREMASGVKGDRAYIGEGAAGYYGYIAGIPEGIRAAWEVLKTGENHALPREITTGTHNPYTEQKTNPIGGKVGAVLGLPSRELSAIHALQSSMAYRSQLHSLAYRDAVEAGLTPGTSAFRNHAKNMADFPTEQMMDAAVEYSKRMTFTDPLLGAQKDIAKAMKLPGMRYLTPFANVPMNTLNAAVEGTPLAWMNDKMKANLKGENGKVAQDTQIARLAAGSAITGMATYWALSGNITGNGPVDPEDRALWMLAGNQPNSIRAFGQWWSFEKFAPLGLILGAAADLTEVGKSAFTDKEYDQAAGHLAVAASNTLLNNTGMKGLYDLANAFGSKDKVKELTKWANNFAASFSPFSSGTGQIASAIDPNMREVHTLLDAFKNKYPVVRETLFPIRDWSGIERLNGRSGLGALLKNQSANPDPVDLEMSNLGLKIDKMSKHISVGGGFNVELTDKQYDRMQDIAGLTTRMALKSMIEQPGWAELPPPVREEQIRNIVNTMREQARRLVKLESAATEDSIIQKGMEQRLEWMTRK